ncbi:DUF4241 domain-containing protein [Paenibacillus lutrae]|uniref:DUF4241 domain-containing protein n=1 Tax=Paenibacillus lutrae TaxID=2078573 RepID=A0A7X3FKC2_9BACL|nr:DUF4241 domain-containing protein [Paenibacillus lutrae]MVP01197.1 DUF4241 domain-containing protein [Paenibacillus lutrae]
MTKLLDQLSDSADGVLRSEIIDHLKITSGKVVACDPLLAQASPFGKTIQPGTYPVAIWRHTAEERIAVAELKLSDSKPVRWEMAVKPGQNLSELEEGSLYGYPVDTGLGCFADEEAILKLDELEATLMRELGEEFISLYDNLIDDVLTEHDDDWGSLIVDEDSALNVIMFRSGYGDGYYASYWGIDGDGQIVSLVTDFNIL